ncbi:hypothetical protein J3R03_002151 [Actinoplanes couchii]|uniref:Uncharacterized protein n=2 Tax=Actinoplanes couchii TaxID=403638 RepID=A0ABQ3XSI0_9ACTN|nr:hypothetical protein [Actinoplanes couchii]MDR6317955.1 hypothetical protein [Actinoplanes couchii]GID61365.1 hypothetical protein Aco03nite_097690 [Actinoplanes couchii]
MALVIHVENQLHERGRTVLNAEVRDADVEAEEQSGYLFIQGD